MKRFRLMIAATASIAALATGGCAVLDGGTPKTCPSTAILDDAGELVRFASSPPKGANDIVFTTRMKFISGVCDSDEDEVVMELNTWMEAVRGPANAKGEFSFVYFVAILDHDKKVLTRVKFPMVARFQGREGKLEFADGVTVTIPRKKGDQPTDYIVYLGFEMTPEELAFNRKKLRNR